jgi:hypothetical protein
MFFVVFTISALAQEPVFTFTSESGKTMKGHFTGGSQENGKMNITDETDGNVFEVAVAQIDSITLIRRKPPYTTKCSSYSKAVIVFSDGSKMEGCIHPFAVEFVTGNAIMQAVTLSVGKFVREKQ